jgi:hypothetical protein
MKHIPAILFAFLSLFAFPSAAQETDPTAGEKEGARYRTYGQKYKDMVFSYCVASAYKTDKSTLEDAFATAELIYSYPFYGEEAKKALTEIGVLINQFLARNYEAPVYAHETGRVVPFNLAKCIDLYHSKALDANMRKSVPNPEELPKEP